MKELKWQQLYVTALWGTLFLIGIWHLLAGAMTERVFSKIRNVRLAGIGLLLMALPCLVWPQPYFFVTGIILVLSGILRAVTPGFNVRLEKGVLPRWGHGLVITGVAVLGWLAYQYSI